jgi:hypothetical protein
LSENKFLASEMWRVDRSGFSENYFICSGNINKVNYSYSLNGKEHCITGADQYSGVKDKERFLKSIYPAATITIAQL